MKYLKNSIKANVYKMIHSKLIWIHIGVPVLAIVLFCAYYQISPWTEQSKVQTYIEVITAAYPMMIAIITTIVYEIDCNAGKFQLILSIPDKKIWAHMGNLIALLIFGFMSNVIVIGGFAVVFSWMGYHEFTSGFFLCNILLILFSNIVVYLLQYFICYTFGKGVSLGVGILATLLSPLLCLGLGDAIWMYVPCSYAIRMTSYHMVKVLPRSEFFELIQTEYKRGFAAITIMTVLCFVVFVFWTRHWQGTKVAAD